MKLYHYSKIDNWDEIKEGSWVSEDRPGLGANLRMGIEDEGAKETLGLWAFLSPVPEEWKTNEKFPNVWDNLKANMGKMLLEIDIDENDTTAFVADWAHMEGYVRPVKENEESSNQYTHKTRLDAEGAYYKTKISLKDFLDNHDALHYTLPEVILTDHVPLEKIKISETQPLLQEYMDLRPLSMLKEWKSGMAKKINEIPELKKWWEDYLSQREYREGGGEIRK